MVWYSHLLKNFPQFTVIHTVKGFGIIKKLKLVVIKMGSLSYTIVVILHTSKVMLKILQARFQQYINRELPDVQTGFRKGRGTRDQIANICWIIEKAIEFQKTSISALLTMPKPLTM